jgi:hypothetical protein
MENRDISNNQQNLFNVLERSYKNDGVEGMPVQDGKILDNLYLDRVNKNSYSNDKYERYNQLDIQNITGVIGKENSQKSKLPNNGIIDARVRNNETSDRFNYAYHMHVDKRLVDVSGQYIENNKLRIAPNRQTQYFGKTMIPQNKDLENLSNEIYNISSKKIDDREVSKSNLFYKARKQKLTREELLNLTRTDKERAVLVRLENQAEAIQV